MKGGKPTEIEEIVRMALSQKAFFGKRGGITFSGGEPTLQAKALIPLFKRLKEEGIHICLDSNGSILNDDTKELFKLTDMVLLDIKEFNAERHFLITGRENNNTLETAAYLQANNIPMWIRYVLVPGHTDFEEDIRALGTHFQSYSMIQRIEILPYHTLGAHKYEALKKPYLLKGVKENTPEKLEIARKLFEQYFPVVFVN